MQMTVSEVLARFVSETDFSALNNDNVVAAKTTISDCIGCTVAGSATEVGRIVRRVAQSSGGEGKATIIGGVSGASAQAAALVNGAAAHALDYDDILWSLYGHPSVTVLSATLAVAETEGASGRDLIQAYAIGVEIIGKLGRAVNPQHYEHGWHATASIGVIGAAAACAKLMRLTEKQIAMALGIAASQASGVRRNFGTMTKPLHAGNAARAGVFSAELARDGFTSSLVAFEGEFGWARTLNARTVPDSDGLQVMLGKPWELTEPGIVLKRYPSCGGTHCALDAMIAIKDQHNLKLEEIERIDCDASPFAHKVLLYPRPVSGLEGKFSMEFCLAVAAIEGSAALRHFDEAWINDPRVQALLPRISFNPRADLEPAISADAVPAEVTVFARGQAFSQKVLVPSGDPRNPMSTADRRAKFMDCADGILETDVAEKLFNDWERLDQVAQLDELLSPLRPQN
ncbi:hypothetical protein CR155_07945 [Pollutimonas nitritireducens]|uniref:MmgE/PrpD family protein n=2 Tax=Pollutimonas nitritireducens TaxID=2045209 RepID=A0A2N4UI13_9BURK|nr:hypothetical protein CR155_07945 [Pollutimonas nitritireducens]